MSDKPVAERLQVKGQRRLAVVDAPEGMDEIVGARHVRAEVSEAEVVLLFVKSRASFEAALPALLRRLRAGAILWIAYPKLTSALAGDLSRDVLATAAPSYGLDIVSLIAIDRDWSALRLKRML